VCVCMCVCVCVCSGTLTLSLLQGRASLEQATDASPALTRVELGGNPCLSAGPAAALSKEQRELVAASWAALDTEGEGTKKEVHSRA